MTANAARLTRVGDEYGESWTPCAASTDFALVFGSKIRGTALPSLWTRLMLTSDFKVARRQSKCRASDSYLWHSGRAALQRLRQ